MRIAVQGAGAMGSYFGGVLARAGEDVTMLARGAGLEALRSRGLTVRSPRLGDFTIPVTALDSQATSDAQTPTEPMDLILFCVKTYDTESAAEGIRGLVGPDTVVVSVQNGVDSAERIGRVIGPQSLVGGVSQVSVVMAEPGVVVARMEPAILRIGELAGGVSPRILRLVPMLEHAGIVVEQSTDISQTIWEKYLFICALSGVTALTRLPLGPLLEHAETRALLRGVLDEVAAVARARGVGLPDDAAERIFTGLARFAPELRGSMADDLLAGKRLEVDALNGEVGRLGERLGVPTPINRVIAAALAPCRDGRPELAL